MANFVCARITQVIVDSILNVYKSKQNIVESLHLQMNGLKCAVGLFRRYSSKLHPLQFRKNKI